MDLCVNSLLRLDIDQYSLQFLKQDYKIQTRDSYELESEYDKILSNIFSWQFLYLSVHILFDDAFHCMHGCDGTCIHDDNEIQVNSYVLCLMRIMERSIKRMNVQVVSPTKIATPYGGRLEYVLPGKTKMHVHLKNKNLIRHRKRWSQVRIFHFYNIKLL